MRLRIFRGTSGFELSISPVVLVFAVGAGQVAEHVLSALT
jgi:hypothetical protein